MSTKNAERDLWWEARQKNASQYKGMRNFLADSMFKIQTTSLRGRPVIQQMLPTALAQRSDVVWFPDLNLYRPYLLKTYFDAGCKAAMVRIGGPKIWQMDKWEYTIDPTFRTLMEEAAKLGVLGQIIGYWVHNPFEYRTIGDDGMTIQTRWIDKFTMGGYMPQSLCYDHEISKCWLGTGAEFPCTAVNEIESLRINTANTQNKFGKKMIDVYSAKWFMNQTADFWNYHYSHFSNVNRPPEQGGVGITRPLMMAWYGQTLTQVFTNVNDIAMALFNPTPEQIGNYLYCGFQANSWQFTDRLNIGGKTCDFNVSLDPSGTFFKTFGLIEPGTTPTPDPDPDPVAEVTREEFLALDAKVAAIDTRLKTQEIWRQVVKDS